MDRPVRGMRWARFAVAASLALNLFLITFIGTQAWRWRHLAGIVELSGSRMPLAGLTTERILRQISEKLPADDAALMRAAFAERLPALLAVQQASLEAMDRVRADIARRPYDNEQVRADLLAAREARRRFGPLVEQALLSMLPLMSDQGRHILSEYRLVPPPEAPRDPAR